LIRALIDLRHPCGFLSIFAPNGNPDGDFAICPSESLLSHDTEKRQYILCEMQFHVQDKYQNKTTRSSLIFDFGQSPKPAGNFSLPEIA
jgi:hypothetical protein